MQLTVSIKLLPTSAQKQQLLATMRSINAACDYASAYAFEHKAYGMKPLHAAMYRELREKFGLSAQLAVSALAKVRNSYATDTTVCHTFRPKGGIDYDCNSITLKNLDSISILTTSGREHIATEYGDYRDLDTRGRSAKLIQRGKHLYLNIFLDIPEAEMKRYKRFIGVDMGIVNIATVSTGKTYSGAEVDATRLHYGDLRKRLQKRGSKSAKKHLRKLSGKERNFKKNTNHTISKQIVQEASRQRKGIAIEDLSGFRKTVSKEQNDRFGKWAFYELATFIRYKAAIAGIPVFAVDPKNTSRTCSRCGHCEKKNRKSQSEFKCLRCNFRCNADLNAAMNIAARAASNSLLCPVVATVRSSSRLSNESGRGASLSL
jgi:putative transposase